MATSTLVGRTIDAKYRLDALVGGGSMGTVYKATQLTLQKTVAIKVMKREFASEETYASRFKREAKAASRLDHPNSLRVIDFGDDDGLLYIAMEYLDGRDLLAVVSQEFPLASDRIVELMSQTLAALAVAHEMGIVHRDLKPENVMIVRGRDDDGHQTETVKVCDFGVAKLLPTRKGDDTHTATATGTLTAMGVLIGTPEYMSPEQVSGEDLDARSDLYSLGVILYQLLTRKLPFENKSAIQLAMMHLERVPKRPSELVPDIDPRLEAICLKAMQKAPKDRYADARSMRADLRSVTDSVNSKAPPGVEPLPPVSTRVVPRENGYVLDTGPLSSAATVLAPLAEKRPATPAEEASGAAQKLEVGKTPGAASIASGTVTQPSAVQLELRKRRRFIALFAIAFAVGLLLFLAR